MAITMKIDELDSLICAISHSKLRKTFGLVVCGLKQDNKKLYVGHAMQWSRNDLQVIIPKIKKLQEKLGWNHIIIDQQSGQHFIKSLKLAELNVNVISTQKNIKDEKQIENLEILDKIEMTQLFLTLKNNHQIIFPENDSMKLLEDQVPIFSEHITEAGTADYYASGEEPDDLIKSLIMCGFSYRKELTEDVDISFAGGAMRGKRIRPRWVGMGDGRKDSTIVQALSGVPGRIIHYY